MGCDQSSIVMTYACARVYVGLAWCFWGFICTKIKKMAVKKINWSLEKVKKKMNIWKYECWEENI